MLPLHFLASLMRCLANQLKQRKRFFYKEPLFKVPECRMPICLKNL